MFVAVTLEPTSNKDSGKDRISFWRSVRNAAQDLEGAPSTTVSDFGVVDAKKDEDKFKEKFALILQNYVNSSLQKSWKSDPGLRKETSPSLVFKLISIEYGSITSILEIFGVSNTDIRDFVLSALEVYAPQAFKSAMDTDISVSSSAAAIGKDVQFASNYPENKLNKGKSALDRMWVLMNFSLLIPVVLALYICYQLFLALTHEVEVVRSEGAATQAERTEIIKSLIAQDMKMSDGLVTRANDADVNSRTLNTLMTKIWQKKTQEELNSVGSR